MINKNYNCITRYVYPHWWYPRFLWDTIKTLFHGIKYARQRINEGICDSDAWNLDDYLSHVIVVGLRRLAATSHSYPTEFHTFENWAKWLNETADMIEQGYMFEDNYLDKYDEYGSKEYHRLEQESYKKWQNGIYRVADYIGHLWD